MNARARNTHVEATLNHPFAAQAIVCVVDCANGLDTLRSDAARGGFEARRQVANADRILLNKADAATDAAYDAVAAAVAAINPAADARRAVRGAGDFDVRGWLLETGCFGAMAARERDRALHTPGALFAAAQKAHGTYAWGAATARLPAAQPVDAKALERLLGTHLWAGDDDRRVFRCKGAVHTTTAGLCLVQGVYDTFEVTPLAPEDATDDLRGHSVLTFIGVDLDVGDLEAQLRSCCPAHDDADDGRPHDA